MRQDIPLGRVAGIRVGANWTVVVMLALFAWLLAVTVLPGAVAGQSAAVYWLVACAAAVLLLASLLGHELSHALVARRSGLTVRAVTLWMLGGVTELEGEPRDAGAELRIALVGPATSAVLAGAFLGGAVAVNQVGGAGVAAAALAWLGLMNAMLAVFNMLPGAPLDGGRVLRALLWRHYRDRRRAEAAAARAGQFLGAGMIGLGAADLLLWANLIGGLWLMLIGWFLIGAAGAERRFSVASAALEGVRVSDVMLPDPQVAYAWMTVKDLVGRTALWSRQDAFPVVDVNGTLTGVVVAGMLARIPPRDRAVLRLDRVALAVPASYLAAPEDPAGPLLTRPPLGGEVLAVVLAAGQITGIVTVTDIRRATRWRDLTSAQWTSERA